MTAEAPGRPTSAAGLVLPPGTAGFTVFRSLPDGRGRQYSAAQFTQGTAGAEWFLRQLRACGLVRMPSSAPSYALLDAIDADGEVLETFDLPTRQAFAFAYRKLGLRVAYTDGDPEPARPGGGQGTAPAGAAR
jgi:hypothetical protein